MTIWDFCGMIASRNSANILHCLRRKGEATSREIADDILIAYTTVTRKLTEIRRAGLVTREPFNRTEDKLHRRSYFYRLVPEVSQWLAMTEAVVHAVQQTAEREIQDGDEE